MKYAKKETDRPSALTFLLFAKLKEYYLFIYLFIYNQGKLYVVDSRNA